MVEIIRSITDAVDKIGLLAVLILVIVGASFYVVYWNKQLVSKLSDVQANLSDVQSKTIKDNTLAMLENTRVFRDFASKWDSDQVGKICKAHTEEQLRKAVREAFPELHGEMLEAVISRRLKTA